MPVTSVVQDLPRQVVFDSFDHQHGQTSGTFPTPFDADVRYRCHWLRNVFEKRDVGFQDMAAAPAQRCVGFQSKVPPDHAGCGNAPHSHPLDASGHLGDVGLQGVIFWTQISSKSKTLKTATEKKPCHIENGNKIKEASVSGGNCWCASNFEKPSDYTWYWISKVNLSAFRYCNKSRYIASWRTSGIPAMFHSLRMLKALRTKWLDSREKLGWCLTVFKAVKSVQRPIIQNALLLRNGEQKSSRWNYKSSPSLDTHQFTSSQMSWRVGLSPRQ